MRVMGVVVALAVAAAVVLSVFDPSPASAFVLSSGTSYGPPYGSYVCADVSNNSLSSGTPVQAWRCVAGPNQQFEFYGWTIYTEGGQRCLDTLGGGTSSGTPVVSATCYSSHPTQEWYYYNGLVVNEAANLCLDAGNQQNGTQLVINPCNGFNSQDWILKGVVLSNGTGYGPPYGGDVCADVKGNSLASGTPVQAWTCMIGPNQQFELYFGTILTEAGQECLAATGTSEGAPIVSECNNSAVPLWNYAGGEIKDAYNLQMCLDAGNQQNGTQLALNNCSGAASQLWQIK